MAIHRPAAMDCHGRQAGRPGRAGLQRLHLGRVGLAALDEDWYGEPERAAIAYAVWRLDPSAGEARQRAADLYAQLVVARPTAESLARFTELSGEPVALAAAPLALPELITRERHDLDALVEQADALLVV